MKNPHAALVIGNGESRACLNLEQFNKHLTLIGCNAIHRDLNVDHLVCCDQRMVQEVINRKRSHKIENIYTRERYFNDYNKIQQNKRVKLLPPLPYQGSLKQDQPEHWGSGPYAILLAASLGFEHIFIIGFDLYGKESLVNNIYKDTQNYLLSNKPAVDPSFWVYQNRKIFISYPNTKFTIFNQPEWSMPSEWILPNVEFVDLNKFYTELANTINTLYT